MIRSGSSASAFTRAFASTAAMASVALVGALVACSSEEKSKTPTFTVETESLTRVVTAQGNLKATVATPIMPPQARNFRGMTLAWIAADGSEVKAGEVVVRFDASEFQRRLENGVDTQATASAKLQKERVLGRSAAAKRDASARLADLTLEKTRRFRERDEKIYSRNQLIEAAVDEELSIARREHAQAAKTIERGIARAKADLAAVDQKRAQFEISSAQTALKSLEIRAPADGLLILSRNWRGELPQVGEQVWPGQTLAEIPQLEEMEAQVFVLELDGGGLAKDMEATISVDSMPGVEYPAKVKHVDDLAKQKHHEVPVQYFTAIVSIDKTDPAVMKPGQRVTARIQVATNDGLVIPRSAVFIVDGEEVVFRREDGKTSDQGGQNNNDGFTAVPVVLGAATAGRVVAVSGLSRGDEIALVDPRESSKRGASGAASAQGGSGQ